MKKEPWGGGKTKKTRAETKRYGDRGREEGTERERDRETQADKETDW